MRAFLESEEMANDNILENDFVSVLGSEDIL